MKKTYTKKQIQEAIAYWKNVLGGHACRESNHKLAESEDLVSFGSDCLVFSARDVIREFGPSHVKSAEYSRYSDSFDGFVADEQTMRKVRTTVNGDTYRAIAYWQKPYVPYDPATTSVIDVITDFGTDDLRDGYDAVVGKAFPDYDPEFDSEIAAFVRKYPTYDDFFKFVAESTVAEFIDNVSDAECTLFADIDAEHVKVLPNGTAYVVVLWRS